MTRSTVVALLCLALAATACQDASGPLVDRGSMIGVTAIELRGVVAIVTDDTPKLALLHDDVVTYLTGNAAALQAHLGETVRLTGKYDDAGMFVVASFTLGDYEEKKGGTDVIRRP